MLAVSSRLVCDQIEGADGGRSEPLETRCSGVLVEWRNTELLSMVYNHCLSIDWNDHTGKRPGDKLKEAACKCLEAAKIG